MSQMVAATHRMHQPVPSIDLAALKTRQQAMWASGDFSVIGTTLQIVGESLCEAVDLEAGARVLDVACGNGNAALAAARRGASVTGLDYVPELVRRAGERARAEQLAMELVVGDAERLPFEDGDFEVALSTFGVMFTRRPRAGRPRAAAGGAAGRPHRPGQLDRGGVHRPAAQDRGQTRAAPRGRAVPPGLGVRDAGCGSCSDRRAPSSAERKEFVFRYQSAEHFIEVFRRFYGPTYKAFGALDAAGQARLAEDIAALSVRFNRRPTSFVVPAEYLEVVIER